MELKIINYKKIEKGFVQASFDIHVTAFKFVIKHVKLMKKDSNLWISLPNKDYQDKDGNKKYFEFIQFLDQKDKFAFQNHIIKKIQNKDYESFNGDKPKSVFIKIDNENEVPF